MGQRTAARRFGRAHGIDDGRKARRSGVTMDQRSGHERAVGAGAGGAAIQRGIGRGVHGVVRGRRLRLIHPVMTSQVVIPCHGAVTSIGVTPCRMGRAGANGGAGLNHSQCGEKGDEPFHTYA